ncbi:hypothetical protein [Kribbella sp. NPDC051770]|uniref:hypothetical protein n=1 Tax=Kribbella sp. NPDC051770 TaxID=3155413 RepID=UPI003419A71F
MKKTAVAAVCVGLAFGGLTATPAFAADDAPTNVKISWKDDTFEYVHVTWEETGDQPNRVFVQSAGSTDEKAVQYVAAGAPNAVDVRKTTLSGLGSLKTFLQIGVSVGTADSETSPVALSPEFDTIALGAPKLVSWAGSGTSTLQVKWTAGTPARVDKTPGDPLDRDVPAISRPVYTLGGGQPSQPAGPAGPATELTFTGPVAPFGFYVLSENEWFTGNPSETVRTGRTQINATIPTWVVAGSDTVIKGTYVGAEFVGATLQARNSATSPWYAVASHNVFDGYFEFTVASRGTRQYRVAFANATAQDEPSVWYGGYSPAVTTTTQQKAEAVPATPRTVAGEKVDSYLSVSPEVNGTAQLQRWTGSTWTAVGNVTLKNGAATGVIHQTTVGTTSYRYYVPAHTFNGLGVAAAYSNQFALTTYR